MFICFPIPQPHSSARVFAGGVCKNHVTLPGSFVLEFCARVYFWPKCFVHSVFSKASSYCTSICAHDSQIFAPLPTPVVFRCLSSCRSPLAHRSASLQKLWRPLSLKSLGSRMESFWLSILNPHHSCWRAHPSLFVSTPVVLWPKML